MRHPAAEQFPAALRQVRQSFMRQGGKEWLPAVAQQQAPALMCSQASLDCWAGTGCTLEILPDVVQFGQRLAGGGQTRQRRQGVEVGLSGKPGGQVPEATVVI